VAFFTTAVAGSLGLLRSNFHSALVLRVQFIAAGSVGETLNLGFIGFDVVLEAFGCVGEMRHYFFKLSVHLVFHLSLPVIVVRVGLVVSLGSEIVAVISLISSVKVPSVDVVLLVMGGRGKPGIPVIFSGLNHLGSGEVVESLEMQFDGIDEALEEDLLGHVILLGIGVASFFVGYDDSVIELLGVLIVELLEVHEGSTGGLLLPGTIMAVGEPILSGLDGGIAEISSLNSSRVVWEGSR
jgi:hypothetical protein